MTCPGCNKDRDASKFKYGGKKKRKYCKSCNSNRNKNIYRTFKKDKCEHCNFVPIHPVQLDVDHIDGNHKNHDPSNLQTLCANCHRLKTLLRGEFLPRQAPENT